MKTNIFEFTDFVKTIENNEIVYLFGTGISSALTGKVYSWKKWITDGINCLKNKTEIDGLKRRLNSDNGADNLVTVAGLLLKAIKRDGAYQDWMQSSFESNTVTNFKLAETLSKLAGIGDVFATTNYDLLLEKATDLLTMTYSNTANAFNMLNKKQSTHVIHIHGVYDSINKIDDIIADKEQYESILNNEGAQFIQNLLGTRTLIFIGCGKTTDDLNVAKFIDFAKTHLNLDRKYYYLHNKDQQPSSLPENIVAIPYGNEYSDLTGFLEELCDVRLTSFMKRNPLVGRNIYKKESANILGLSSYHFTREEIKFCGREAELSCLNAFISSGKSFSWWAVTGQGGSGKSRLALEFLNRTKTNWFGFFLSDSATVDSVEALALFKNTLIIVDYVKGKEKAISQILVQLINRFAETKYKLRILFLERDGDTSAGSWYSELTRYFPYDALSSFQTNEYAFSSGNHAFLNLGDMAPEDILQFIGYVCRKNGLPDDSVRDAKLMEDYGKKFEKLQFRPLFVQMYIEAWIENDCLMPRYDGYEDLLKFILAREQKRWLHASGGNVRVCSALIRLVVFANCFGKVKISSLPESLKSEWDIIENYVRENNFPGKQSEDAFKSLINEICQSGEHSAEHINPLYPDILKEYMLIYYCSDQERMVLADYLWGLRSEKFSALVIRCIYDFPFNEAINSIVTNCDSSADNPCVLAARLNYLKLYVIKNFEDAKKLRSLLKNEYEFWRALIVKPKTEDSKILNIIKFCGLTLCAQQFGAWLEIDRMICVLEEAMSITGGDELNVLKVLTIQERIRALSLTGFTEEAQVLENKFSSVLRSDTLADVNGFIKLDNLNVVLINYLKVGNFYKANEVLKSMNSLCDMENIEEVKILSLSCLNMARLSFMGEKPKYLYGSINILQPYYERYSQDTCVASRYLQSKLQTLQYEFFVKKVGKAKIESELYELEKQMPSVTDEYSADVWAMCKIFKLNFIKNDKNELINQLENSVKILQNVSQADTVVQVYIDSAIALHTNVLKDKVTKEEVDKAYSYMLRFPESESIRGCFFEMLEKSTEANNRAAYMPHQVLSNAFSDIMLNPLNDSGIPELDKLYEKAESIDIPYVRGHRKIGRNEPCPCGSGKKFKKCCLGNGIYD